MPKNKKSRVTTRPFKGEFRKPSIVREAFQAFFGNTMTAGSLQIPLAPDQFANNITTTALVYSLYRFVELEYELLPRPASSNLLVVGYYPDAIVTAPASVAPAMENLDAIIMPATGHQTVPRRHVVPLSRLRGLLGWYKCNPDAADADVEDQGTIQFTGTGTEAVNCIVRGVIEFRNVTDTSAGIDRIRAGVRAQVVEELRSQFATAEVAATSVAIPPAARRRRGPANSVAPLMSPLPERVSSPSRGGLPT